MPHLICHHSEHDSYLALLHSSSQLITTHSCENCRKHDVDTVDKINVLVVGLIVGYLFYNLLRFALLFFYLRQSSLHYSSEDFLDAPAVGMNKNYTQFHLIGGPEDHANLF